MSDNETHDVVVIRTFDAPLERMWRAWSDPDEVMTWWGPLGFTSPKCRMDFREGGATLVCMRSNRGWELFNTWTYRSIEPMDRIEFDQGFADKEGHRVALASVSTVTSRPKIWRRPSAQPCTNSRRPSSTRRPRSRAWVRA